MKTDRPIETPPLTFLEKLIRAEECYGFDGQGAASQTTDAEYAIFGLLARPERQVIFSQIVSTETNLTGVCFALAALHYCNPEAAESHLEVFESDTNTVLYLRGCIGTNEPMSEIVREIRFGKTRKQIDRSLLRIYDDNPQWR